jgi:RHS repeat-associated protein
MKKHLSLLILLLLCSANMMAQTFSDDNFIYTAVPKKAVQAANFNTLTKVDITQNVTYFDGLGRATQTIAIGQGGNGEDIITPVEYDAFGRQPKEYLPYATSNGGSSYPKIDPAAAINAAITFYSSDKYGNTSNPFSQKKFEPSPLNRVLKQAAPGASWAMDGGHEIKLDYQTNTDTEVKLYQATTTWNAGLGLYDINFSDNGNYEANQLYKTITYDENTVPDSKVGTEEFKNKEGQVILKRTYESKTKHDTYYVYDSYGNLTYVLPPMFTNAAGQLEGLCYQYKYDNRNRLVEKKLPGKQWEFIVYDKLDRPVATGPAFSPFKDDTTVGWLITKYDVFGRAIYTGWYNSVSDSYTRKSLQDTQNSATVLFETKQTSGEIDGIAAFYTNVVDPKNFKLLTVNYYDNYVFPNVPAIPTTIEGQNVLANTKTLATGSWIRAVTTSSATLGETTAIFYDAKARPIRSALTNYLGVYTNIDSKLDAFSGQLQYTITKHKRTSSDTELMVKEEFTYSPQDRLLTHTHQINGGIIQLLAANTYDELGQLMSKNVGNTSSFPLQKVDYTYNIRGWLTGINNDQTNNLILNTTEKDLFGFKINYNTVEQSTVAAKALYNGNIAETAWATGSDGSGIVRWYGYKYDQLNRLKDATYQTPKLTNNKNYFGENMDYDKNGNIIRLQRKFMAGVLSDPYDGDMDNLSYFYDTNSNQLMKVTDASNEIQGFKDDSNGSNDTTDDYAYDSNGNLTKDDNKAITLISYNHLNLPIKITFGTTGTIEYIYNAAGQKLEKIATQGTAVTSTNYLGGYQYLKTNLETWSLQFFPTAEGYVKNTAVNSTNNYSYVFNYTDHLGNIRLSYSDADKNGTIATTEIVEESNYYPFGLKHKGYNSVVTSTNPAQKRLYNGKELQDELGLNWYDYQARNYDPALGRWMNIDPLAETSRRFSPYAYALNNPVYFIDPDGMQADDWKSDAMGNMTYDPFLTKDNAATRLGAGESYVGKTATETVPASEGVGEYTLTYNDNGSIDSTTPQVASSSVETTGTVADVATGIAAPLAKFGSSSNIASQTFAAASNGVTVTDNAIDGLTSINNVSKFGGIATGLSKAAPMLNAAVGIAKVSEGYSLDGGKIGVNTRVAVGGSLGSAAGSWAGAEAGAVAGAAVGALFGGVGAVPGAIIGGVIGGIGGGMAGEKIGEKIAR